MVSYPVYQQNESDDSWTILEHHCSDVRPSPPTNPLFHSAMDIANERQLMNELPERMSRDQWVATALDSQRRLILYRNRIAQLELEVRRLSGLETQMDEDKDDWEKCKLPSLDGNKTQEENSALVTHQLLTSMNTKIEDIFVCSKEESEMVSSGKVPSMMDIEALTTQSAVAVDQLIDMWNYKSNFPTQISFSSFAINDLALFFPTMKGHFVAFHVNAPHRVLSEESKALIGTNEYFRKEYFLGRIVHIAESLESAQYDLPPGTLVYILSVAAL